MACFRGALVFLISFSLMMSQCSATAYTTSVNNCLLGLCSLGTRPDPANCSNYFKCSSPIMSILALFRQWTNVNWSQDWNVTTCTLKQANWVSSFQTAYSINLNQITGLGLGKIMRMKRDAMSTLISSLASSGGTGSISAVTNLGPSVSCVASCKNCYFDDLFRDCRLGPSLNPARRKACNIPATTAAAPASGGVGLTNPTTTTTTAATAPGAPAVGQTCPIPGNTDYPETIVIGCQSCTVALYCPNGTVVAGPCLASGSYCYQSSIACNDPSGAGGQTSICP